MTDHGFTVGQTQSVSVPGWVPQEPAVSNRVLELRRHIWRCTQAQALSGTVPRGACPRLRDAIVSMKFVADGDAGPLSSADKFVRDEMVYLAEMVAPNSRCRPRTRVERRAVRRDIKRACRKRWRANRHRRWCRSAFRRWDMRYETVTYTKHGDWR